MKKIFIVPVVMITLAIAVPQTYAWVEPDQLPPNGNIAAPLNTGSFAQSKIGGLILGLGNTLYGLIVKNGNSGFGTETPTEKIDVNGNIKLNGRIIGLQAPVAGQDAANKDYVNQYVDAMGGGGSSYETVWGTTECAPGDVKIYDGVATIGMSHVSGLQLLGGGGVFCKKGEKLHPVTPQQKAGGLGKFMAIWSNGYDYTNLDGYTNSEAIECALCKAK